MPLDPQAQAVLEQTAALGLPPNHPGSPADARANGKARPRAPGPEVAKVEDRTIPGPDGQVPVRIYRPDGSGPFPILVWFHGGGWVVGDLEIADATARHLAVSASCVVVSVDYRLAPETKFPGPAEDCYSATQWAAQNAYQRQWRPGQDCGRRRQRRRQPGRRGMPDGQRPAGSLTGLPAAGLSGN